MKIRDEQGKWRKPLVMEYFDTGSRYMYVLEAYFAESNENSVELFTRFLLSTDFADKKIRIRPDNAKGFLNLKRPIRELNLKFSMPDRFYLAPDFCGVNAPKHKVHLESSHRSLSGFIIIIDEAADLNPKLWPYFKRIIDANIPIIFAGLPKVRTFLLNEHPDIISRLKVLRLYPILNCGTALFTALKRYSPVPEQPTVTVITVSSSLKFNSLRAISLDGGSVYCSFAMGSTCRIFSLKMRERHSSRGIWSGSPT